MPNYDAPHFARPFRVVKGSAQVYEQDSVEEIMDSALTVLRTQVGTLLHAPEFGIIDPTFLNDVNYRAIDSALERWEPRGNYDVTTKKDVIDALIERVTVNVEAEGNA